VLLTIISFWLIRKTEPLACSDPAIVERFTPVTSLSVAPEPLLKLTTLPLPMEKPFQSMMPVVEDWSTVSDVALRPFRRHLDAGETPAVRHEMESG
jgi:hypothetical protein